jgi:hypothetical protein
MLPIVIFLSRRLPQKSGFFAPPLRHVPQAQEETAMFHIKSQKATARAIALLGGTLLSHNAFAWGHTGHVEISTAAIFALPAEIPAFVRTVEAAREIGELGPEADISKTTVTVEQYAIPYPYFNNVHDAERDPGHYIDIDDSGVIVGGVVPLNALPATREKFDTAQRTATAPAGQDQYTGGYLPYTILDGFEQVRKDFGIYRALLKGQQTATTTEDKTYFAYQLSLRKIITLRDIGYWSHFVGDASQPLHVSIHYNGWGNYPNPNGYTTKPIHAQFEGAFVKNFVSPAELQAEVPKYHDCGCAIEARVPQYLAQTLSQVVPLYQVAGTDLFQTAQPAEVAFATARLAAGAAELRDEIVDAWRQSTDIYVGYPLVKVSDILSGAVTMTRTTLASD